MQKFQNPHDHYLFNWTVCHIVSLDEVPIFYANDFPLYKYIHDYKTFSSSQWITWCHMTNQYRRALFEHYHTNAPNSFDILSLESDGLLHVYDD